MDSEQCHKRAREIIRQVGRRDMRQVAKELNIKVLYNENFSKLLGMYFCQWRHRFIFLNTNLDDIWQNMVLAHEIGHDQLHRDIAKQQQMHEFELFRLNSRTEYEANAFAAHLLMDTDAVYAELKEGCDEFTLAQKMNCNINLTLIKLQEMAKLGYDIRPSDRADSQFFKKIHV